MKNLLFGLITTLSACSAMAQSQYALVNFDADKSSFNENQPLPAERFLNITGQVMPNIQIVEMELFNSKSDFESNGLYKTTWRCKDNCNGVFSLPITYKLRGDGEYDFVFKYYKLMDDQEKLQLYNDLNRVLNAYVLQAFSMSKKRISLVKSSKESYNDLNDILSHQTKAYKNYINTPVENFSDLVLMKLEQIDNTNVKNIKKLFKKRQTVNEEQIKLKNELLEELLYLLNTEVDFRLRDVNYKLADIRKADNYPVEKVKTNLKFDVGYAGVFLNQDVNNLKYGAAPYVGLTFPFGNSAFRSKFVSNMSMSAGVMLKNINTGTDVYTGPVVGLPVYLGFAYSLLPYVNFQAGAVGLENKATGNVGISPYIGLSLKLNLGIGR